MNKPRRLDSLADRVLSLLSGRPEAGEIVLGGYLALQHHLDHRTTHDIDAWWRTRVDSAAEQVIREAMRQAAGERGMTLQERRFGDTLSFELVEDGQQRFSFQIAVRSITVEEPRLSAWPPVRIETLADILFHLASLDARRPLDGISHDTSAGAARSGVVRRRVRSRLTPVHIDGSVYPDVESPPRSFESTAARADYVHRICSAWDYGVAPRPETFALLSTWKDAFDRFRILTSPAYHAMRIWFQWEPVPMPAGFHPPPPRYIDYDRIEGRGVDPCEQQM